MALSFVANIFVIYLHTYREDKIYAETEKSNISFINDT